jgi:hypothetical protein
MKKSFASEVEHDMLNILNSPQHQAMHGNSPIAGADQHMADDSLDSVLEKMEEEENEGTPVDLDFSNVPDSWEDELSASDMATTAQAIEALIKISEHFDKVGFHKGAAAVLENAILISQAAKKKVEKKDEKKDKKDPKKDMKKDEKKDDKKDKKDMKKDEKKDPKKDDKKDDKKKK